MTHVDDLHEPGDDREPEPCDWHPTPEPADLDEVESLHRAYLSGDDKVSLSAAVRLAALTGDLLAELREARQRIAEWEALPTREEWAGTVSRNEPPEPGKTVFYRDFETAEKDTAKNAAQLWRRMLSVHPWEPIDSEAPF
jgi:hypothetical protein